ncbi:WD repeat-containing protein jip5 [Didymella keratinophila]|nr:WD repeat-containing protein jip5 [Didymella keratinophila]
MATPGICHSNGDKSITFDDAAGREKMQHGYKPLETPNTIRLLRLCPGTGDDPLRGVILHTDLGEERPVGELVDEFPNQIGSMPPLLNHFYQYWPKRQSSPLDNKHRPALLHDTDRRATVADQETTYCVFPNRNYRFGIKELNSQPEYSPLRIREPYEALSYVWGAQIFSRSIPTNEGVISITQSLAAALKHFRHTHSYRYLWADAVCINQLNNEEKAQQVQFMSRVYTDAEGVLVWLGTDPALRAHPVCEAVKEIHAGVRKANRLAGTLAVTGIDWNAVTSVVPTAFRGEMLLNDVLKLSSFYMNVVESTSRIYGDQITRESIDQSLLHLVLDKHEMPIVEDNLEQFASVSNRT